MNQLKEKPLARLRILPEYCDARNCPAVAKRVILSNKSDGTLSFCRHHFNKYELKLIGHIIELDECGL